MNTLINENSIIYLPKEKIDDDTLILAKKMTQIPVFNNFLSIVFNIWNTD